MSREEIEQVEKELDEVLEIVQRPVPVKNTGREETVSLQENLQENDPLQEEMQIETEKEEKEEKEDSPESAAKEQTAVSEEELDLEDDIENGYFHFLRPSDGLIEAFFVPVAVLIILFAQEGRQEVQIDCHKAYPVSFAELISGKRKEVHIQQTVQIRMTTGNVNRPAVTRPCNLLFLIITL